MKCGYNKAEIRSKSVFSTSPSGCWTSSTLTCRLLHVLVVIQLPWNHCGKERFSDMIINCALIQIVEKIAEKYDKSRINTKAQVTELIMSGGVCTGCIFGKGEEHFQGVWPSDFLPVENLVPISLRIHYWQRNVQICCTFPQQSKDTAPVMRSK